MCHLFTYIASLCTILAYLLSRLMHTYHTVYLFICNLSADSALSAASCVWVQHVSSQCQGFLLSKGYLLRAMAPRRNTPCVGSRGSNCYRDIAVFFSDGSKIDYPKYRVRKVSKLVICGLNTSTGDCALLISHTPVHRHYHHCHNASLLHSSRCSTNHFHYRRLEPTPRTLLLDLLVLITFIF